MNRDESGICLHKTSCDECGSSDARQVYGYDDKPDDSYCFSCAKYFPPTGDSQQAKKQTTTRINQAMTDIKTIQALPIDGIPDRGITKATAEVYRVRQALSQEDRSITHLYSPDTRDGKLVGYESKQVKDKSFTSVGDRKGSLDLWGKWTAKGFTKLIICEGRLDAMSVYQCMVDSEKSTKYKPNVVSLTRGASGGLKDLINNSEFTGRYKEVILCLDSDTAGQEAIKAITQVFPMFKVAKLPLKDASDMLVANRQEELYKAVVWDSVHIRQGETVEVESFLEKALEKPVHGISYPWPTVDKATYGIRPHRITVVAAAPKVGKSDFCYQLLHHLVFNEGQNVGIFDLENSPMMTAKKMAGKFSQKDYTRPDTVYEKEELREALLQLSGKVKFYDRGASRDWSDIRQSIEEQFLLDGTTLFFIDPITALISKFASSQANDELNLIMTEVADLCSLHPIHIFFFSHVNPKPKTATPHEKGGKVLSVELTGGRAIEKWSHTMIGISRDRSEESENRNMSEFYMVFDRDYGNSFKCDVEYNPATQQYLEPTKGYNY